MFNIQVDGEESYQMKSYSASVTDVVGPLKSLRSLKIDWDPRESSSLVQLIVNLPAVQCVEVDTFSNDDILDLQQHLYSNSCLEMTGSHPVVWGV